MSQVTLSVRVSRHLAGRLDEMAADQGIPRSAMLRQLIMDASPNGDELPTEPEIMRLLWERARSGNVGACKYLLELERRGAPPNRGTSPIPSTVPTPREKDSENGV